MTDIYKLAKKKYWDTRLSQFYMIKRYQRTEAWEVPVSHRSQQSDAVHILEMDVMNITQMKGLGWSRLRSIIMRRTRQIIRYQSTATLRRPQIKQHTTSQEEGAGTKPTGTSYDFDKVWSGAPDSSFGK